MIESVKFTNFRALRDTTLPLGRFTLIVGPNGSGKSTAVEGITLLGGGMPVGPFSNYVSVASNESVPEEVTVEATWAEPWKGLVTLLQITPQVSRRFFRWKTSGATVKPNVEQSAGQCLGTIRSYALDARTLKRLTTLQPKMEISERGEFLAGALDRLRDESPERFEALNDELGRWLPEFDRVLFDTPDQGLRQITLRLRVGGKRVPATYLSDGTVFALGILSIAYAPKPPFVVCLEDPDHGMHPRLLRDVRDALYRLAHPEDFDDAREPVQVIATTHSPYFLNLFKDHPEEIVIAEKLDNEAKFVRLVDLPNIDEILRDSDLGDVWYTGILGGVPSR